MSYSFYTSFNVPSVSLLFEEMNEREVKADDDPDRDCWLAAETIVKLMLKLDSLSNNTIIIGVNADGKNEVLATSKNATESWDYVLTMTDGYFMVSVKSNAAREARFEGVDEGFARIKAELEAKYS